MRTLHNNKPRETQLKRWALYWRVSELLPSSKEGWRKIKRNSFFLFYFLSGTLNSKFVCQGATPWKTGIFVRGRVERFTESWVSCCWVPKRDDLGWSKICILTWNSLRNCHLPERNGWALYRRVSELVMRLKEGWHQEKEKWQEDRRKK